MMRGCDYWILDFKTMNNKKIIMILAALLLLAAGCEKEPYFGEGDYLFTPSEELKYLENHNGILINWNDGGVTEEQQVAIREIVDNLVAVEGGTFQMGSNDELASNDEHPVHAVTLSNYRIAKFTVTRKQWRAIMRDWLQWNGNYGTGDDLPATNLDMDDVQRFLETVNRLATLNLRLPTEAEWEYAARGGKKSHGTSYSGSDNADAVAWHQGNGCNVLHPVGSLQPNELGLYDMSGNVWEWCSDWYGTYSADAQTNPQGPNYGDRRVVRGGSFSYEAPYSRVSQRKSTFPYTQSFALGFRVVMDEK